MSDTPHDIPDWYCTYSARGDGWGSRGDECPVCGRYMFDGTESATKVAWWEHYDQDHKTPEPGVEGLGQP